MDSWAFSASFGFALDFAKDLNMSPAICSFFVPDLESVLLSVLEPVEGRGVDCPEFLSSEALPLQPGADVSFCFEPSAKSGLVAGFGLCFLADTGATGAYLAVLRYTNVSTKFNSFLGEHAYLNRRVADRSIHPPSLHGILVRVLRGDLVVARGEYIQVLKELVQLLESDCFYTPYLYRTRLQTVDMY